MSKSAVSYIFVTNPLNLFSKILINNLLHNPVKIMIKRKARLHRWQVHTSISGFSHSYSNRQQRWNRWFDTFIFYQYFVHFCSFEWLHFVIDFKPPTGSGKQRVSGQHPLLTYFLKGLFVADCSMIFVYCWRQYLDI